jgi:tyrosine-specific transport protein
LINAFGWLALGLDFILFYRCLSFVCFTSENENMIGKQFRAIFIVAGAVIGSGIITLPVMIAKLGILLEVIVLFVIRVAAYHAAIVNFE